MRALFAGSCAKEADRPEANEDAYTFSPDGQRLALSDGASESYDSRIWARLLADKFAADPTFGERWLQEAIGAYQAEHDFAAMSWSQQFAFERGCFATLLGVDHQSETDRLRLLGVGDSIALLLDGAELVWAWPLDDPERFRERPTLLSTLGQHNDFARAPEFDQESRAEVALSSLADPTLLCMTDALGEWSLRMAKEDPARLARLRSVSTEAELADIVLAERASKRMRVDDSTLAILRFDAAEDDGGLPKP